MVVTPDAPAVAAGIVRGVLVVAGFIVRRFDSETVKSVPIA